MPKSAKIPLVLPVAMSGKLVISQKHTDFTVRIGRMFFGEGHGHVQIVATNLKSGIEYLRIEILGASVEHQIDAMFTEPP